MKIKLDGGRLEGGDWVFYKLSTTVFAIHDHQKVGAIEENGDIKWKIKEHNSAIVGWKDHIDLYVPEDFIKELEKE